MGPTIEQTIEFIKKAHAGQVDKAGEAYWKHPVSVMERLVDAPEDYKLAALLHDVIEDTDFSAENLRKMGYSADVVRAVELLTKHGDMPYLDEVRHIRDSGNPIAIAVKIADNLDNLDQVRLAKLKPELQLKAVKYRESLAILRQSVLDNPKVLRDFTRVAQDQGIDLDYGEDPVARLAELIMDDSPPDEKRVAEIARLMGQTDDKPP